MRFRFYILLGLLVVFSAPRPAAEQSPVVPPALAQRAAAAGRIRVIVQVDAAMRPEGAISGQAAAAQRATIAAAQNRITARLSAATARTLRRFSRIPFLSMEVTVAALAQLATAPGVLGVVEDRLERPTLMDSVPLIRAQRAWSEGADGTQWAVAVLDTGVEKTHQFLSGKVVSEACFSALSDCPNNTTSQIGPGAGVPCTYSIDCDHGTHVAGIAAGSGTSFSGVAKGASLIPIQVFSDAAGCSPCAFVSDQIAALEHVYDLRNTFQIAAVNMSLGGGQHTSPCDASEAARKAAIDNLRSVHIATIIASGNNAYTNAINAPACISTAVSVGATTKSGIVASFSNSASFLTLLAPGVSIYSSVLNNGFAAFDGTSMATPHVSGTWAVLRQSAPSADVSTILAMLQWSAVVVDSRNGIAKPRIDVFTAKAGLAFTDPLLTAGVTVAKLAHLTELRARINTVRTALGLPAAGWTVPAPSAGVTQIKAVDIVEMRSALAEAYAAVGLSMPAFTDPTLTGVVVKTTHINELRQRVIAME